METTRTDQSLTGLLSGNRRAFLRATGTAFAALAASGCAARGGSLASAATAAGYGPLQPDPAGVLDLPIGFSYRVISRMGDAMSDGGTVPDRGDGMGLRRPLLSSWCPSLRPEISAQKLQLQPALYPVPVWSFSVPDR